MCRDPKKLTNLLNHLGENCALCTVNCLLGSCLRTNALTRVNPGESESDPTLFDQPTRSSDYVADTEKYLTAPSIQNRMEQASQRVHSSIAAAAEAAERARLQQELPWPRARDVLCILWGPEQLLGPIKEDRDDSLLPGSLGNGGRGLRLPQHFSPLPSPPWLPCWPCFSDL